MIFHAYNLDMFKKKIFCIFIALITHAYFASVLLLLHELDNLVNKSKIKPFFGNGYRRKYETQNIPKFPEIKV